MLGSCKAYITASSSSLHTPFFLPDSVVTDALKSPFWVYLSSFGGGNSASMHYYVNLRIGVSEEVTLEHPLALGYVNVRRKPASARPPQ